MAALADGLAARLAAEDLAAFDSIVFSGYSLGGVFAHEVAQRVADLLPAAGRDVPAIQVTALLLDPPDPAEPQLSLDDAFDIFVRVGWRIGEPPSSFSRGNGDYDLAAVAAAARRAGTLPPSSRDAEVRDAWQVYASNARILDGYALSGGVRSTELLQCRDDLPMPSRRWLTGVPATGSWAAIVPASRTSALAVEHFALMESPNDEVVARWLVDRAERHSNAMTAGRRDG
jgi:thioesterase domain-containing protein